MSDLSTPPVANQIVEVYDDFAAPGGYTLDDYHTKWHLRFGPGEMAVADTRAFTEEGFHVSAVPFRTSSDVGVGDHLKYIAVSTKEFAVPREGSLELATTITATTPGTQRERITHGTYIATGEPYAAPVRQGQQAGAVMNLINFATGQLFDWFICGETAFALIERLPSNVTGNTDDPHAEKYVGREKMYTQIIKEIDVEPGPHDVSIRFTRDADGGQVDFGLDGAIVAHVDRVGVPLDRQRVPYTGTYPSLGEGEELANQLDGFVVAHGLYTLIDAFPFGHPEAPELTVSVPQENRLFGQGATATFGPFTATTRS
jgi:hypothetical protein